VRVFFSPTVPETDDRLSIGCGVAATRNTKTSNQTYCDDAYVPIAGWRSPTEAESLAIGLHSPGQLNRMVGLISVLEQQDIKWIRECIEFMRATDPKFVQLRTTDEKLWKHPLTSFLLDKIKEAATICGPLACNTVAEHEPGLTTVTFNHYRQNFIGLHIDGWDKLPVGQLPYARNRVSVNLGQEDRHFMFVNLTVDDMLTHLRAFGQTKSLVDERAIGKAFMATFPDYPLIKLTIRPGEAYVAPTDNILHDATTMANRLKSCHIAFRGYFNPGCLQVRSSYDANAVSAFCLS
jgi:hypothetical protein